MRPASRTDILLPGGAAREKVRRNVNTPPPISVFANERPCRGRGAIQVRPDEEAQFAGLVERQWRFAYRVAWAVLRQRQDAEDAAQEAFLKILRAQGWRGLRDERAFVARIVWRVAVDASSRQVRLQRRLDHAGEDGASQVEAMPDPGVSPEEKVVATNWEAAVHRLIDSLPEELRQTLVLSVEMNSREIAEVMGIAEGTVRTRLMRARQRMREKMAAVEEPGYARR